MSEERKAVAVFGSIINAQASGVSDALLRGIAAAKLDEFKAVVKNMLDYNDDIVTLTKEGTITQVKTSVWNAIVNQTKDLIDAWKAGLGLQMGTAFMGLKETYTGLPRLLSGYKQHQLEASIFPMLDRYFRSTYTPMVPSSKLAFQMLMEGQISRKEFNQFSLEEGWATKWHDKLYEVYNRDPNIFLAFTMFKRGLITEAKMQQLFRISGYDASYDSVLYNALHRRPTFRELTVLAEYTPLSDLWVSEVMRAQGYLDTDINYILPAIRMRPLREEVRSVVGRYLWEYQIGRITRTDLEKYLKALGLLPKEVELNMKWGDLRYADELIDEELAIIEARVQAGDPALQTTDDIFTALADLGILDEKANLMAELWYYQYVYTPP